MNECLTVGHETMLNQIKENKTTPQSDDDYYSLF